MTKEELKAKIDELIGMESELIEYDETSAKLRYTSPTGVVLFDVDISDYGQSGWEFGGHSGALPGSWKDLCKAHRVQPKSQDPKHQAEHMYWH